jgi:ABC-2 type transport system permease protein
MSDIGMPAGRLWSAYFSEIRFEFLKSLRTPAFAVPTLLFPVIFYVMFGIFLGSMRGNAQMAQYTFAAYGVFGAMGPGLFGFGVSLAIEREQGLLTLKQALPQPAGAYLLARAVMAMLFVGIISVLLLVLALTLGKVPLSAGQAVQLFFINVLGALPFCAIGMFVGALVSGQASPAIVNLIFLPMAFLSGLWLPLQFMGQFLQDLAPVWPAYHLAQMALAAVGAESRGSFGGHIAVLAGVTLLFFLLAVRRMAGGGLRMFGANPRRTLLAVAAVIVAVLAVSLSGVFGGKPATEDATAATEATSTATGTPAPEATNQPPAGVPAPADTVIADFDEGSARAPYGIGMVAGGDENQGGKSTATQQVVEGGALGSKGALEVSGEIRPGAQYPTAGTFFFPQEPVMEGLMDYSGRKALSFHARGDGKRYTLFIFSGAQMGIPLMYRFTAGTEWQRHELKLAEYGAADFKRIRGFGFAMSGEPGPFKFQIDDVRLD